MSRFNPAWWLFYGAGKAALRGLEKAGEFIDQLSPEEEDEIAEDEKEESSDDHEDEEDQDDEEDEAPDDKDDDAWDEEHGLHLKDQDWWDEAQDEHEHSGDDGEGPGDSDEKAQEEGKPEKEYEVPLSDKFGRWAEQKMSRIVGRAARAGLRYVTRTDWDDDDDEVELPHDFLACRVASSDEDEFEPVDYEGMPEEPPRDRGFESIYDLITPPHLNEDKDLENEGWEEDDDDENRDEVDDENEEENYGDDDEGCDDDD